MVALWVGPSPASDAVADTEAVVDPVAAAEADAVAIPVAAAETDAVAEPQPAADGAAVTDEASAGGEPTAVVDTLHEQLIGVMKDADELGYEGRFRQLEPVLNRLFDIPFMAEKSVGRYWRKTGDEDRARLLTTFGRFTVANYAGRFDGYSDQIFETVKEEVSAHGTILVHSRLVEPNGDAVQLNYRLRPAEGGWRIIDVYLNGTVSELALRRSEYSSLIQREGFAALLVALDERIHDLAAGKTPDRPS
jgi:phospholipid transport system substrate-binding protein